ncbi:MAG: DUF2442 domain-containing protein [Oscillospiraceae bacterium]|nr:DUF2442 domain-containing protein [Oscillospiraceae bacterium]
MKIFAIRDATDKRQKDLAYLLYYEVDRRFYIELQENADPWETPLLLSSFVQNGEHTVNSYWSRIWVQQRIVPPDRQNIGQILRDNGLKSYDEFSLLMLSSGRCEQDDYYLVPVDEKALPNKIIRRFDRKIEDVVPLQNNSLLVFFRDGTIRRCDLTEYFEKAQRFSVLSRRPDYFARVHIQTGGYGIQWDENLSVSDSELYKMGKRVPLTADDFRAFASERIINAAEAAEILNCSRQYINELVKSGKLHPVKSSEKNTMFLKSEVLRRNWQ